jgi:hypothetical protein
MITEAQMRKIWAVTKEKGLDEDMVRAIAQDVSGRPSISGLTKLQAIRVIDRLESKASNRAKPLRDPNMMTEKQEWKIRKLEQELGWQNNPQRLLAFVKKYGRVERLDWLTKYKARNIIDGLKALLERQGKTEPVKGADRLETAQNG